MKFFKQLIVLSIKMTGTSKKNIRFFSKMIEILTRYNPASPASKKRSLDVSMKHWKKGYETGFLLFTAVITNKCTLRCRHCFEEAGPEKDDFLDAERLEQLAEEAIEIFQGYPKSQIRITGGDPFLHLRFYDIISSFSKRKDRLGYGTLDVETNGWWAVNDKITREILLQLREAGADLLSMTYDYYHCEKSPFNNKEHLERIFRLCETEGLPFRTITVGNLSYTLDDGREVDLPTVTPVGRGRFIDERYWGIHDCCNAEGCRLTPPTQCIVDVENYNHTDEIMVNPIGNVYPCYSGKEFEHASLALGNIYEKSLPEILGTRNPLVELLEDQELLGLSRLLGFSDEEHWEMYERLTPCGLCHKLLREYGKEISAAL
jgi:MoaA/NifB/PqqE/SkfB family radical SAM enzyme